MKHPILEMITIILCIILWIKPTDSKLGACGTLEFEQDTIEECQSARLIYTPTRDSSRKWMKEIENSSPTVLYDSMTAKNETKFLESKRSEHYFLIISAVKLTDSGNYIVSCGGSYYSSRSSLTVTKRSTGQGCVDHCGKLSVVESTNIKEGDQVQFKFTVYPGKSVIWEKKLGLNFEQLVDQRYIIRTNTEETIHSLTIATSKHSDGGEYRVNCSVNVSNIVNLNVDPSERPVTEAIKPASESNIASVIGPIVGCLLLVIIIAIIVALIVRKKRRNTPLQRKNTPEIKIEERNPSSQHVGNEPIYNNMAVPKTDHAVDEQPEYACVIPKAKRGEASGSTDAATDARKENKERDDNLGYADLDLADYPDIAASRPMVTMHEQTEYVSIDFSKTGTPMIDHEGGKN